MQGSISIFGLLPSMCSKSNREPRCININPPHWVESLQKKVCVISWDQKKTRCVGESVSNPHSGHHCYTSLLCNAVMMSSRYNVHCPEDTGPAVFSKAALYAHKYLNTPACVCACNAYMHALTCAHKYTLTKSHSYSCNQTHELCVQNFRHLWDRLISGKRLSQAS